MIWASLIFEGSELFYIPVLNPGSCEGKTWYVEFVGDVPNRLVLEAESVCDALFVLNNDPEWGNLVYVAIAEDEDEPEGVQGTQFVRVHGEAYRDPPYPVRYHDEGFPDKGIDPRHYAVARFN